MTDLSVAAAAGGKLAAAVPEPATRAEAPATTLAAGDSTLLHRHLTDRATGLGQLLEATP